MDDILPQGLGHSLTQPRERLIFFGGRRSPSGGGLIPQAVNVRGVCRHPEVDGHPVV
jgi:hypothetical protein